MSFVASVGRHTIDTMKSIGAPCMLAVRVAITAGTTRPSVARCLQQIERVGVGSLGITVGTGLFAGAVMAMQTYKGLSQFGGTGAIGPVVALTMVRELGPVFTGIMVAGRAGSAIAAELGTMKITEQLDALKTLGIDMYQYLLVPRFIGCMVAVPLLSIFSMMAGIIGGYLVGAFQLHFNTHEYIQNIPLMVDGFDVTGGLIKAFVFGTLIAWIGCYQGITTGVGAVGVGNATTTTVVIAATSIVIANYILAVVMFGI